MFKSRTDFPRQAKTLIGEKFSTEVGIKFADLLVEVLTGFGADPDAAGREFMRRIRQQNWDQRSFTKAIALVPEVFPALYPENLPFANAFVNAFQRS